MRYHRIRGTKRFVGIVVMIVLAAACSGTSDDSVSTSTSPSRTTTTSFPPAVMSTTSAPEHLKPYGGSVTIAAFEPPDNYYLGRCPAGAPHGTLIRLMPAIMVQSERADGERGLFLPHVVTELPTLDNGGIRRNDDGTETYTYIIREDAVWEDGEPISGDDFAFSFDWAIELCDGPPPYPWPLVDRDSYRIGPKSFEVTLSEPTYFPPSAPITPKHIVDGSHFLHDWPDLSWATGGPFEVDRWTPGESIRLVRNEAYWDTDPDTGQQLPYLDEVVLKFYETEAEMVEAFKQGEVDIVVGDRRRLAALSSASVRVSQQRTQAWEHLAFNLSSDRTAVNSDSMIQYVQFRRAVAHAIDRRAIAEALEGDAELALDSYLGAGSVSPGGDGWAQYDYSVEKARQLISDLCREIERDCERNPPTLVFSALPGREPVADLLAEMLGDAGIEAQIVADADWPMLDPDRPYEMSAWTWVANGVGLGPQAAWYSWVDPIGWNPYGLDEVTDHQIDRLAELVGAMQPHDDALGELILEAEQILSDQVYLIPLYLRANAGAVRVDRVSGYDFGITWIADDTWNIARWYRVDQ